MLLLLIMCRVPPVVCGIFNVCTVTHTAAAAHVLVISCQVPLFNSGSSINCAAVMLLLTLP